MYLTCHITLINPPTDSFNDSIGKDLNKSRSVNKVMQGETAGMVIGLIMVAIVLGVLITNLDSTVTLTGQANTTYTLIKQLGWVALTILGIGVIAFVGKFIISIFQ